MATHIIDSIHADGRDADAVPPFDEKKTARVEANIDEKGSYRADTDSATKIYVPDDTEEFIDPRLKDYPIPLVAKTVDLHNNFDEPILTFRFFFLSTFWVVVGDAIATMYYFKPYTSTLTSYAVQLLSWGMGDAMARYLPSRGVTVFGRTYSLNPGPWNAKEHALIVVAYWGSVSLAHVVHGAPVSIRPLTSSATPRTASARSRPSSSTTTARLALAGAYSSCSPRR